MKESVLDILIYLFEHYMLENPEQEPDEEAIMSELMQAGFNHRTIDHAFDWLENLAIMCEQHELDHTDNQVENAQEINPLIQTIPKNTHAISKYAMRHYLPEEQGKLNLEARGLLLSLEQCGVLNPASRELVIDRLMALETDDIDIHHIKWVILMVLTNCQNEHEGVSDWTEALILDGIQAGAH
ncbi:MAG: DUF494 domain-containing protein [Arenicellales bacterium]